MADLQSFDNINILKRRSLPYDEYYGDMQLTSEQKKKRRELALILEDYIMIFFDVIYMGYMQDISNEITAKQDLTYNLYETLSDKGFFESEDELDKYIADTVNNAYTSTQDNLVNHFDDYDYTGNGPYWVSEDRAMFVAENEANTLFNSQEYMEAKANGYTHKIWMAYPDDRVRPTHVDVDGAKIPIGSYFDVGRARMLYPKDVTSELSTGADCPEEVVNCRCTVIYV